ncbi:uncharacterized protein V2V93DRAFT_367575 [Kockiozyma suomiensis]|uniref:uncharacterized protein n=1 Tax=Kockiozyma suomiensis TaxID=1337062 RepID=UPI003343ED0B
MDKPATDPLAPIINALATAEQILISNTRGASASLVSRLHYTGGSVAQVAGAILGLEAPVIATGLVLFHRFHLLAGFLEHSIKDTVAGCLFIAVKLCETPKTAQSIAAAVEAACEDPLATGSKPISRRNAKYYNNEKLNTIYTTELQILTTLAFDTHVVVPYSLCLEYLSALKISDVSDREILANRAWGYLNDSMKVKISILHQPNAIAVTALWLAAREADIEILEGERWWMIFDVDTEDMGHIVLLLRECKAIAIGERERVENGLRCSLTVKDVTDRILEEANA